MNTSKPETYFAPAARAPMETILQSHLAVQGIPFITKMIEAFPSPTVLLNGYRQILLGNQRLMETIGNSALDAILGFRVGEAINCVHSHEMEGGCGTSEACIMCGAVNAMLRAQEGIINSQECRIIIKQSGKHVALDFRVDASPFQVTKENYSLVSFTDISDEKRRQVMEQIFFHDVLNLAGGLRGWASIINELSDEEKIEAEQRIEKLSVQLIEEILSHRDLCVAESGDLRTTFQTVNVKEIFHVIRDMYSQHEVALGKTIEVPDIDQGTVVETDPVLLKRVLGNLVKNALEASQVGDVVRMSFNNRDGKNIVSVSNRSVIPRKVQLQLFQRSFSTKGQGRGIGTYSAKLLTERYLHGTVEFTSEEGKGTAFHVILP